MTWAITGTGLVSSLGDDTGASFEAFCAGATSVRPLRAFDLSRYRVQRAYERDDRRDGVDTPYRATGWLCEAVGQALGQAGLAGAAREGMRPIPVLVGTGLAEQRSVELWSTGGTELALDELHFARAVAAATGLTHTVTIANACAASLFALAVATDLLRLGEADAVVVAGTDSISESMFGLLDRVNASPPTEVRPFDTQRRGVILGEGAAAIVLESVGAARSRDVAVLATLRGVGNSCDAHHVTAPLTDGITRAFRDAHRRADVKPTEIDLVLAHGTGTLLNDQAEGQALADVFGAQERRPVVTALKSLIGHTSGASGLMSLVTAVQSLRTGRVPPTAGHVTPIPEISGFTVVTGREHRTSAQTAQVNAFGFGGVNAVAVLDRTVPAEATPELPDRDVVVTGVGLEIPGVASLDELLALVEAGSPVPVGDFDPAATLGRRGLRYKDRATLLGLCAAAHAIADAGLSTLDRADLDEAGGVVVSTELALVDTVCRVVDTIHADGVAETSPMDLPNASGNVASAQIAIWFRLGGLNLTLSSGPTSGVDALYHAAVAIRAGRADRMLVIGVEPGDGAATRLLRDTARRHGEPVAPRPFDGAAAVMLEAADVARDRDARTLARLGGYTRHDRPDAVGVADGGLWFPPCAEHGAASPAAGGSGLSAAGGSGLSAVVGEASAAYGVLQCAVAAARLAGTGRSALISAGGCWDSGYASLALGGTA